MNRKQNVGEAFSGVGRLRKKRRVFFHGLLRQKQKTCGDTFKSLEGVDACPLCGTKAEKFLVIG